VIFRPWTSVSPDLEPTCTWTISPGGDSGLWDLQGDGAERLPGRAELMRAVTSAEFLAVNAVVERPPDVFSLHAALVAREGRGVLIVGPCEAGKSTLACGLWRSGFSLLGDDVALIDLATREARPAPRRVSLRASSRGLLGHDLWRSILEAPATEATTEGCIFLPDDVDDRARPAVVRLAACVFLARRGAGAHSGLAAALPPAQAVLALLPYSNLIRRLDPGIVIARAVALGGIPAFDLSRAPLDDMVRTVEQLLDRESE